MFLIANMSQYFVYDVLVFNACYDSDRATAAIVDLVHPVQVGTQLLQIPRGFTGRIQIIP